MVSTRQHIKAKKQKKREGKIKRKNREKRAKKNHPSSKKNEYLVGFHRRIYRIVKKDGSSISYNPFNPAHRNGTVGRKHVDSIVHRFHRIVGFASADDAEWEGDDVLMEVRERIKNITAYPKSEISRVTCQANFENFVLEIFPRTNPYKKFLLSIQNPKARDSRTILFLKPTPMLINAYLLYMSDSKKKLTGTHKGRENVYNSIRTRLAGISGTCKELGYSEFKIREDTMKLLKKLQGKSRIFLNKTLTRKTILHKYHIKKNFYINVL